MVENNGKDGKAPKIILYQELLANSWPAREYYFLNGWILRFTNGCTGRANSVLPLQYNGPALLDDISLVEQQYKSHGLPAKYQLADFTAPENLSEILLSLGYQKRDESLVIAGLLENWADIEVNRAYSYIYCTNNPDRWFVFSTAFSTTAERAREKREIISSISNAKKCLYMAMNENHVVVGIVLGVLDRNYVCLSDLIVHPDYRKQGIATSLMAKINEWALKMQIRTAILQVEVENSAAISLYHQLGLKIHYGYRYYEKSYE